MSEHTGTWFANPEFLRRLGRDSILQIFAAFAADIHAGNVTLPDPDLPDELYFAEAARLLEARRRRLWLSPNRLPVWVSVPRFNLEPLRELGVEALLAGDVTGMVRVTLCEIRCICPNGHCHSHTSQSDDLFDAAHAGAGRHAVIPRAGKLTRATLRVQFADSTTSRSVVLCPPQTIQLLQATDAGPIRCWLERRGFQRPRENSP